MFKRKRYEKNALMEDEFRGNTALIIDDVRNLFDDVSDSNYVCCIKTVLYESTSFIIFDEVKFCPMVRQEIKPLAHDVRYYFIETAY